jgi:hypothetical protein
VALASSLNNETARAQGAEATLQSNFGNETARAQGAETTLANNLAAETGARAAGDANILATVLNGNNTYAGNNAFTGNNTFAGGLSASAITGNNVACGSLSATSGTIGDLTATTITAGSITATHCSNNCFIWNTDPNAPGQHNSDLAQPEAEFNIVDSHQGNGSLQWVGRIAMTPGGGGGNSDVGPLDGLVIQDGQRILRESGSDLMSEGGLNDVNNSGHVFTYRSTLGEVGASYATGLLFGAHAAATVAGTNDSYRDAVSGVRGDVTTSGPQTVDSGTARDEIYGVDGHVSGTYNAAGNNYQICGVHAADDAATASTAAHAALCSDGDLVVDRGRFLYGGAAGCPPQFAAFFVDKSESMKTPNGCLPQSKNRICVSSPQGNSCCNEGICSTGKGFQEAQSVCFANGGHVCTYSEVYMLADGENGGKPSSVGFATGEWLGTRTGDDLVLYINDANDAPNFEGETNKNDSRDYHCCLSSTHVD